MSTPRIAISPATTSASDQSGTAARIALMSHVKHDGAASPPRRAIVAGVLDAMIVQR
jgi:hypothetical protein